MVAAVQSWWETPTQCHCRGPWSTVVWLVCPDQQHFLGGAHTAAALLVTAPVVMVMVMVLLPNAGWLLVVARSAWQAVSVAN